VISPGLRVVRHAVGRPTGTLAASSASCTAVLGTCRTHRGRPDDRGEQPAGPTSRRQAVEPGPHVNWRDRATGPHLDDAGAPAIRYPRHPGISTATIQACNVDPRRKPARLLLDFGETARPSPFPTAIGARSRFLVSDRSSSDSEGGPYSPDATKIRRSKLGRRHQARPTALGVGHPRPRGPRRRRGLGVEQDHVLHEDLLAGMSKIGSPANDVPDEGTHRGLPEPPRTGNKRCPGPLFVNLPRNTTYPRAIDFFGTLGFQPDPQTRPGARNTATT